MISAIKLRIMSVQNRIIIQSISIHILFPLDKSGNNSELVLK